MLKGLSIRDIVLIERLDLSFDEGLTVITGETGAGKSILLDSLGLATGARAERALVRQGQDTGTVSAEFSLTETHPIFSFLNEQGIVAPDDTLILRRQVSADGKSRAWVNDQPVSQGLLSELGGQLVEVHGQHDDRGLLEASAHRVLLDSFGGYADDLAAVSQAYASFKQAEKALAEAEAALEAVQADEEYILHSLEELQKLNPIMGEEDELNDRRAFMMQGEKLSEDLQAYLGELSGRTGADSVLRGVLRRMERTEGPSAPSLMPIIQSLDRASIELDEATAGLSALLGQLEFDPQDLDAVEERLFEIRRLARKHTCRPDELVTVISAMERQAKALTSGDEDVRVAKEELKKARDNLSKAVAGLTKARRAAATRLDKLVTSELPPLKLDKAIFRTRLEALPEKEWNQHGGERVFFEVKTNPTTSFGPMVKVASGGELARFILALKVVLAEGSSMAVMVFDEVDKGIGGATASAVGERLKRLSTKSQVLVVTHSPQVAACGDNQYQISKSGTITRTSVVQLSEEERREEIARMLAGSEITDAARAAAEQLLSARKG